MARQIDSDAIEHLTDQHREVQELFGEIERAQNPEDRAAFFSDLADKLAIHATLEERFFYPAVRAARTEDLVLGSLAEHAGIKRLLADLLEADPSDPSFEAGLRTLEGRVAEHIEEEELQLFPAVSLVLSHEELASMAQQMTALEPDLEERGPRALLADGLEARPPAG